MSASPGDHVHTEVAAFSQREQGLVGNQPRVCGPRVCCCRRARGAAGTAQPTSTDRTVGQTEPHP